MHVGLVTLARGKMKRDRTRMQREQTTGREEKWVIYMPAEQSALNSPAFQPRQQEKISEKGAGGVYCRK